MPKISDEKAGKRLRVVAIDPGCTTGVVWCDLDRNMLYEGAVEALQKGEWNAIELKCEAGDWVQEWAVTLEIRALVKALQPLFIVFEDFVMAGGGPGGREVVEPVVITNLVRGAVKGGVRSGWQGGFVFKSASSAKSVVTDVRMKRWNLWITGMEHARDAMRVLILFLREYAEDLVESV